MNNALLGIEIGGTKLQLFVADSKGTVLERARLSVPSGAQAAMIQAMVEAQVKTFRRQFQFQSVGVGFGGPVDWRTGKIARSHQIEGWSGFDLVGWLNRITGAPVAADNDANVAALAEAKSGAGRKCDSVFYITLGSGVGGGLVTSGRIYHGATPGECEVGHLRLDPSGVIVEERCSGWAVDRQIRELPKAERTGPLWKLTRGMDRGQACKLAEALDLGDPAARRILNELSKTLAFGLSHVTHLLHPEVIVIGGGLSGLGEPLRAAIENDLPGFLMDVFRPGPKILLAQLREDAVPIGALHMAATHCVSHG